MKKISSLFYCLLFFISANTQNVGIGTTNPQQKLHVVGTSFLNGNVGIANSFPTFPLSFNAALGDKISLWSNSDNSYGFGIQPSLLQIHTDVSATAIVFGYGSSAAFTERVRIINEGPDGISIQGRVQLKNGTVPIDPAQTPGIWFYKTNNSGQLAFIGTQNEQNIGFYGGTGDWGLVYDAISSRIGIGTSFPTQKLHVEGTTLLNGNVGISNNLPFSPLTFSDNLGEKISFYGTPSSNYGIRLQSGLLQFHTDGPGADIAIGYYNSGSFTENMRIKGNSMVGIGNNNPSYQLDLSNRMRIRSGGNNSVSAGLWLNNNSNSEAAFFGMEDDTHVGFFGTGTGWKFSMNTQNGALKINGSEGAPGQVVISNGAGTAPGYTTLGNIITTSMVAGSGAVVINAFFTDFHLPSLSQTITLTKKSRVIISANVSFTGSFCLGCETAVGYFKLRINGTELTTQIYEVTSGGAGNASFCNFMWPLDPGIHTIDFYVRCSDGTVHTALPKYSSIIILPID